MISGLTMIASLGLIFNSGVYGNYYGDTIFELDRNSHLKLLDGSDSECYSTGLVCLCNYQLGNEGDVLGTMAPSTFGNYISYYVEDLGVIPDHVPIDEYGHFEYVCTWYDGDSYYYSFYSYYAIKARHDVLDLGDWQDFYDRDWFIGGEDDSYILSRPTVAMYTTRNNQGNARSIVGGMAEPLPIVQDLGSNFLAGFTELFYKDNNITYLGVFGLSFLVIAIVFGMIRLAMNLIGKNTGVK